MKLRWWDKDAKYRLMIFFGVSTFIYALILTIFMEPVEKPVVIVQQKQNPLTTLIKIIQQQQPRIDPLIAKPMAEAILKYSKKYNFPPELIIAIINRESKFRPMVTSSANCVGLMQINPPAHPEKLKKLNIKGKEIFYIDNNIQLGCMILRKYYDNTKSIEKALTKYVGGKHPSYVCDILSNYTDLSIKK